VLFVTVFDDDDELAVELELDFALSASSVAMTQNGSLFRRSIHDVERGSKPLSAPDVM
jgi:hypothetical protein